MSPRAIWTLFAAMLPACGGETPPPQQPPPPTASVASAAATATAPAPPASAPPPTTASASAAAPGPTSAASAQLTFKAVALPGAKAPVSLDYVAYEPAHARVWVPVGDTGSVDVFDVAAGTFARVDGFKTGEREYKGRKRAAGPSAIAIGDGVAYVGDRASSEVCAVDLGTLKLGKCQKVAGGTDGVAYVGATKEVWVTAPGDQSIVVFDVSKPDTLKPRTSIKFEGDPEGFAFDGTRGLFFTNLEDKNKTVAIDLKTHKPKSTFSLECNADGPRGVAADVGRGFLYVACTDRVLVLDGAHGGAKLSSFETGAGVDNIDWLEPQRLLYAAAGKAARLTVARIDDKGQATVVATASTAEGARNGVADASGNAYVPDANGAQLLVFPYSP